MSQTRRKQIVDDLVLLRRELTAFVRDAEYLDGDEFEAHIDQMTNAARTLLHRLPDPKEQPHD